MRRHLLSILCLLATLCLTAQEFNPDKSLSKLSSTTKNIGITAACAVNGELIWSKSSGLNCKDQDQEFTSTTLTRIASIAKPFTAIAIMQLAEKNAIELDSTIGTYLPDLPDDKMEITVLQLLTHTSGIPAYIGRNEVENTIHYNSIKEAMDIFITRPLLSQPGTEYHYTTYGYVILGRIIEVVTSMTYENYMEVNIFNRADMKNTFIEEINETYSNKSCLYHNNGRKAKNGKQNDLSNRIPGGGYISTLEDVMKFGEAVLDGKLISEESFNRMLDAQPVVYNGNKYGLGWSLYGPPANENLVVGHNGGQTGCTSQLMLIPKSKTIVVVLSNTSGNYPDIANFASNLIGYSEKKK